MAVDDSFKKPGAVPFKWEIAPGIPKSHGHQQYQHQSQKQRPLPVHPNQQSKVECRRSSEFSPPKLRPPPAGTRSYHFPTTTVEPRSRSFRSAPRSRSERWRFGGHGHSLAHPARVSPGCFFSPLLIRRLTSKKVLQIPGPQSEPDSASELETLTRWSVSSRKSLSPFSDQSDSPTSSSHSSNFQSPPRIVKDAEWAAFGLF